MEPVEVITECVDGQKEEIGCVYLRSILNNRIPGQLVVQITDRCNARCPQCGMRSTETFARSTLKTEHIKRTIDAAAMHGFRSISFTGGEPLLDLPRLADLIRHAGHAGLTFIRTGTNGFMFRNPERHDFDDHIARMVDMLADTPLRNFWISLDSCEDDVHERMRGFPGVVAGIARALPRFHRAGIYPAVNLGINRNMAGESTRRLQRADAAYLEMFYCRYRQAFERFFQRAVDLGFTMANACYPMSINALDGGRGLSAVYAASAAADIVRFTKAEKRMLFKALIAAIRRFRSRLRIFSPICSLESLVRQYDPECSGPHAYACRGGVDFFFVSAADGHVYPCGYRGNDDYGELSALKMDRLPLPTESDGCRRCDWECFRDPSELFGPLLEIFSSPLKLIRRTVTRPAAMAIWADDLLYFRVCDFFDGRRPPNMARLKRFAITAGADERIRKELSKLGRFNARLSLS